MPLNPILDLESINQKLESKSPQEIVAWVGETFGKRAALGHSMQKPGCALCHMIYTLDLPIDVVFVDTQYHFIETLRTRDLLAEKYGLNIVTLYPKRTPQQQREEFGRELNQKEGDYQICCGLRKEDPYIEGIHGNYDALMGGLMRAEGGRRAKLKIVGIDDRLDLYKVNPLANWNEQLVDAYNEEHEVPIHPLHRLGYQSIGCATCTTPIFSGEEHRAGRWRHIREANPGLPSHLYCGINKEDK